MSESEPFNVVRPGCARFEPSLEKLLSRWAVGCDESPFTNARHVLDASGYAFRSMASKTGGEYFAVDFACPHCEAEQVATRGEAPTPACFLTGGSYGPSRAADPRSLRCRACGRVSKPSFLVEHLHPSKPERKAFLEQHCRGARPPERQWVAARHDGTVAVATEAEAAIDEVAPSTFPPEVEICLCFAIEQPANVAELELPYARVPLSERGEITRLGWHGEPPTANEQARHGKWLRRAKEARQREIERKMRLVRDELERETPL